MDSQLRFIEKSVIIHRDENGFGLRVGGQNPVFVDCVHENGAAWKAGVRKDDRIIKVNGTLVRSYDHQRVVQMIQNCTPFVNLTLHSPDPIVTPESSVGNHSYTLGVDQSNGSVIARSGINSQNSQTSNMHIHTHNHHSYNHSHPSPSLHLNPSLRHSNPHSLQGNLNWLLEIGDDLFQDSQQKQQAPPQQQQQEQIIPASQQSIGAGVSKLIVNGPNPLNHSNSSLSLLSASNRHNRSQSNNNTRDNPYYYYKTAQNQQDKLSNDASVTAACNTNNSTTTGMITSSSTASLLGGNDPVPTKPSSSMVRSRSSSKMSTRSTTSKYTRTKKLRSRLVEDLRSLAITNNQATPSSLSTSPSSSDLSDCDDPEQPGARLDCGLTLVGSNLSKSPNSGNAIMIGSSGTMTSTNLGSPSQQQSGAFTINDSSSSNKPVRLTTRRLEIIRELVDTEKTHTEKLKQLNDLLYKPIKAENLIPPDQLKMVFSCHKTLFKIHRQIFKKLVAAQVNYSEQPHHQQQYLQEPLVGKALIEIFEGDLGARLESAASSFCACQSTNTELLNRITRKDTKSGEFLAQVANQQMLGRLGIKDLLASCFQRLTKYPLLLENLLKATPNLAASSADGQQGLASIHSKSLSEGCIALPLNSTASVAVGTSNNNNILSNNDDNNDYESTNNNDNNDNNEKINVSTNGTIEELGHEQLSQSGEGEPVTSSGATNRLSTCTPKPNNDDSHYESIDEQNISSSADTTISSTSSSSTTATTTGAVLASTSLTDEYAYERCCIERALQASRQILTHVNEAVNRAVAQNKLKDIWKKTDKNPSLPVIDIDSQQLLHEGSLTLRLNRRQFEVYVLLLTHYLVILTREGTDKYKLKHFVSDGKSSQLSPIFNIDEHLVTRDSATDENGFYLLCKRKDDERICEFASQSPLERAKWKEKIHLAQSYKNAVPDDDNTLTRYTELISLTNSSNTPNNIEHSPIY